MARESRRSSRRRTDLTCRLVHVVRPGPALVAGVPHRDRGMVAEPPDLIAQLGRLQRAVLREVERWVGGRRELLIGRLTTVVLHVVVYENPDLICRLEERIVVVATTSPLQGTASRSAVCRMQGKAVRDEFTSTHDSKHIEAAFGRRNDQPAVGSWGEPALKHLRRNHICPACIQRGPVDTEHHRVRARTLSA